MFGEVVLDRCKYYLGFANQPILFSGTPYGSVISGTIRTALSLFLNHTNFICFKYGM